LKLIAFLLRPVRPRWLNLSFPSTLYLCPVLDLLLQEVPSELHCELRLGLQEALVNAAKHGNQLNPSKCVSVRYRRLADRHEWIILDQGLGFKPPSSCEFFVSDSPLPADQCECGRGLYILFQVFDRVDWNDAGTELYLEKLLIKSST
jgi:anti-sigma regulatory factor (Ser/Thr protein kinase)